MPIELLGLSCIAHPHAATIAATLGDILHEELLDGIGLVEQHVGCHIGVAEAATGQVTIDAVVAVQDGSCRQHRFYIDMFIARHRLSRFKFQGDSLHHFQYSGLLY